MGLRPCLSVRMHSPRLSMAAAMHPGVKCRGLPGSPDRPLALLSDVVRPAQRLGRGSVFHECARSQETDRECVRSRAAYPLRRILTTEIDVCQSSQISSSSVIGPSLTEDDLHARAEHARWRPCSRGGRSSATTSSTSGSAISPGAASCHDGTAALAGVGVERELADDEHRQAQVGRRHLAVRAREDAQLVDLAGHARAPRPRRRRRPTPTSDSSPGPISPTTTPSTVTAAVLTLLTTARTGTSFTRGAAPEGALAAGPAGTR